MSVGYVVLESGWEYNDEGYNRPESGGGRPVAFYNTYAKAKAVADKKNADYFRTLEWGKNRSYDLEGFLDRYDVSDDALVEWYDANNIPYAYGDWGLHAPVVDLSDLPDDKIFQLLDILKVKWYEVVAVPIDSL